MINESERISYGPVPSRRFGRSLGINHIPPKICTYSCVYCQVGRTLTLSAERRSFYGARKVTADVEKRIQDVRAKNDKIDYLAFVPDGEPTQDIDLGKTIALLKPMGFPVAVISNSSLIWDATVRDDLFKANRVSLKVDAITESIWRKTNRPHKSLELEKILNGITVFADGFQGELNTETMLIQGLNDAPEELVKIADFLARLKPDKSYISIPIRPPADPRVEPANEDKINMAFQLFRERDVEVALLTGHEGNAFTFSGHAEEDLLSITAVHPMREDSVSAFLSRAGAGWDLIEKLIDEDRLVQTEFKGNRFYIRKPKRLQ